MWDDCFGLYDFVYFALRYESPYLGVQINF
jgi:hypothetical protein